MNITQASEQRNVARQMLVIHPQDNIYVYMYIHQMVGLFFPRSKFASQNRASIKEMIAAAILSFCICSYRLFTHQNINGMKRLQKYYE